MSYNSLQISDEAPQKKNKEKMFGRYVKLFSQLSANIILIMKEKGLLFSVLLNCAWLIRADDKQ